MKSNKTICFELFNSFYNIIIPILKIENLDYFPNSEFIIERCTNFLLKIFNNYHDKIINLSNVFYLNIFKFDIWKIKNSED